MSRLTAAHVAGALADYFDDYVFGEEIDSGPRAVSIASTDGGGIPVDREISITAYDENDDESIPTEFVITVRRVNAKAA